MKTINKNILKIAKIANKKDSFTDIAITKNSVIATDGYVLAKLNLKDDVSDFPAIPNEKLITEDKQIIVNAQDVIDNLVFYKKEQKLPILNNTALAGETDETVSFINTDLKTTKKITLKKQDASFPDCTKILNKENKTLKIGLKVKSLLKILELYKTDESIIMYINPNDPLDSINFENQSKEIETVLSVNRI